MKSMVIVRYVDMCLPMKITRMQWIVMKDVLGNCGNIYNLRDQLKNRHGYRGNEASDYNYLFDQYGRLAR